MTKQNLFNIFVISTLSTLTLILSQNDLGFHCFYLEITWKIHGILSHQRSGNPVFKKAVDSCNAHLYMGGGQ